MTIIKGTEGRMWVMTADGELAELGDVRSVEWSYDGVAGEYAIPETVSLSLTLQGDLANLVRKLVRLTQQARFLAAGGDDGHGARR